ncbi:hypothetical protein [Pseudomonas farris]
MKKRPPLLIVAVAGAYFLYLAWRLVTDFMPVTAGRFVISIVLFFFVFRGSRAAGNILAFLSALTALLLLVAAVSSFSANVKGAVVFTAFAGLLLAFAAYVFLSPKVLAFQRSARSAAPTKQP